MYTDGTTGYGSVDHNYRISKYAITATQYCEFLNAKAASDPYYLYQSSQGGPDGCGIAVFRDLSVRR